MNGVAQRQTEMHSDECRQRQMQGKLCPVRRQTQPQDTSRRWMLFQKLLGCIIDAHIKYMHFDLVYRV